MDEILLVYTTWESEEQAKKAGEYLLNKRVCACVNIYPEMHSMFFWPPTENKIDTSSEVVMIVKTLKKKYDELEKEIYKIHTYDTPCIIAIPTYKVNKDYFDWIKEEIYTDSKK